MTSVSAGGPAGPDGTHHLRQRRGSAGAAGTVAAAARAAEAKVGRALLMVWDDLADWRRDNHFIRTGYRADSYSYRASFGSVWGVHNETVNIWTHLLGAVAFPAAGLALYSYGVAAPRYASASRADVLAFACFFSGAALCLGMSAIYHALSNHSPSVAKWGNKLDYTGIVCLIVGSYVPALYYGLFCLPHLMVAYLCGICTLGVGCGVVSWVERFRTPEWRPYRALMFVGLGASGVLPACHALSIYGYQALNQQMGLSWVLLQGFLYIAGAVLYAVRWPERNFPTTFDIWGSSHQLFHILILFAAASHLTGMTKAFDNHHTVMGAQCP